MKMVNFLHPREEDYGMLEHFLDSLRHLRYDPNSEVGDALNILPQSIVLDYRNIYRFYLFKWMYQCGETIPTKYCDVNPPDRLQLINHEIVMEVRQAANAYHIIDSMTFLYLVNDIKYFASIHLITDEEVTKLQEDLLQLLDDLEAIASKGKFDTGKDIHIYISNINFEATYSYIETSNLQLSLIRIFSINSITSSDKDMCKSMKEWVQSLKKFSTMISESGEMQRIQFFKKQREIVEKM